MPNKKTLRETVRLAKEYLQKQEITQEQFQTVVRYALASEIRLDFSEKSSRYLKKYGKPVAETGEVS